CERPCSTPPTLVRLSWFISLRLKSQVAGNGHRSSHAAADWRDAEFKHARLQSSQGCRADRVGGVRPQRWHSDRGRHVVSSSPCENGERGEESTHPGRSIHVDIEWLTNGTMGGAGFNARRRSSPSCSSD